MSTGYGNYDPDYDYTAGDPIPGQENDVEVQPDINADDIVLSGGEAYEVDAAKVEETAKSREFRDIPPGDHLLKVVKLDKIQKVLKDAWINGQKTTYETYTALVRFCLPSDPQSTIAMYVVLPPPAGLYPDPAERKAALYAYVHGLGRPDGKEAGWFASCIGQFVAKICGEYDPTKPLPPTHDPKHWPGKLVWGTVEFERPKKGEPVKLNVATGMPYWPRAQLKAMAFRRNIPGQPDPSPRVKPSTAGQAAAQQRPTKRQLAERLRDSPVPTGSPNGAATLADAGLDSI